MAWELLPSTTCSRSAPGDNTLTNLVELKRKCDLDSLFCQRNPRTELSSCNQQACSPLQKASGRSHHKHDVRCMRFMCCFVSQLRVLRSRASLRPVSPYHSAPQGRLAVYGCPVSDSSSGARVWRSWQGLAADCPNKLETRNCILSSPLSRKAAPPPHQSTSTSAPTNDKPIMTRAAWLPWTADFPIGRVVETTLTSRRNRLGHFERLRIAKEDASKRKATLLRNRIASLRMRLL